MACSYVLSLSGRSFSKDGVYFSSVTPNFNQNGIAESDLLNIECDSMIMGYKGSLNYALNSQKTGYGFRLTVNNVFSGECGAVFDWHPLLRYVVEWCPYFQDTDGNTYSHCFTKEFNTIAGVGSSFIVHSAYDNINNASNHDIGVVILSGAELVKEFQQMIDLYLYYLEPRRWFDKYLSTPAFYIKELGIYKNFGCVGGAGVFNYECECEESCLDSRTSEDEQSLHFIISDGASNVTELDVPFLLSEGASQEIAIKSYMNDTLYNSLINLYNLNNNVMARCMFNGGVVRSSCTVRLVAKVYGQSVGIKPSITPPFVGFDYDVVGGVDVDILKAQFEPCSDKPVSITEDLRAYLQGLNVQSDLSLGFNLYQVLPYKIVIENCQGLTDYCCDNSVPSENDSITIEPTDGLIQIYGRTQGGSSGGDDVNIQCICDNLSNINETLIAFKAANESALSGINDTLSSLNIDVDNQCVCDNLSEIKDGIISVKESIDNKDLSVVNNNTITPPVNNVSVNPPVNNITLPDTHFENIANNTRSLNNIFDELANMNVLQDSIQNDLNNIANNLVCGNDNIACILQNKDISVNVEYDNNQVSGGLQDIADKLSSLNDSIQDSMFNSDDESNLENQVKELSAIHESLNHKELNSEGEEVSTSLADIINSKDFDSYTETIVEPCDYTYTRGASRNLE